MAISIAWNPNDPNDTRLAAQGEIPKLRREGYVIEKYDDVPCAMRHWTYGGSWEFEDARRHHAAQALELLKEIGKGSYTVWTGIEEPQRFSTIQELREFLSSAIIKKATQAHTDIVRCDVWDIRGNHVFGATLHIGERAHWFDIDDNTMCL